MTEFSKRGYNIAPFVILCHSLSSTLTDTPNKSPLPLIETKTTKLWLVCIY